MTTAVPAPAPRRRSYRYFDYVMAIFVTVLLLSNIASSAKLVDLGISIFGLPLAFDGGTILFPLAYIFGDVLTEVYGYSRSRKVIWTGFAAAALMAATFWFLGKTAPRSVRIESPSCSVIPFASFISCINFPFLLL